MKIRGWNSFKRNSEGNVAMMWSFAIAGILGMTALTVDGMRLMNVRQDMTSIADNAAIAGAFAAESDSKNRDKVAREYLKANAHMVLPAELNDDYRIEFNDDEQELYVELSANLDLFFGGLFGVSDKPVRAAAVTSYAIAEIDPVTVAFSLDVSGSMNWLSTSGERKIDVLKDATEILFTAVEDGTKEPKLLKKAIRTGMSAYNTALVTTEEMEWGWDDLEDSVEDLVAGGGTNSTPALLNSYNQILQDRIYRKSKDSDFDQSRLREYAIFMTDGDNNQPVWDAESAQVCWDMRQDGIEIFSVAFTAPEKGQALLWNCASWDNPGNDSDPSDDGDGGDASKCQNNGSKGQGNANGHCKKDGYYFDADDAEAFRDAFRKIGEEIAKADIRIKR